MRGSFKDWLWYLIAVLCIPIAWVIYGLLVICNFITKIKSRSK